MNRPRTNRQAVILAALILILVIVAWDISALLSHAGEVGRLEATIADKDGRILTLENNLHFELEARDSELAVLRALHEADMAQIYWLNVKQGELITLIEQVKAKQAELQKRFDDQAGGTNQ